MSEHIRGSYDDALYKSTYTLLYFTSKSSETSRIPADTTAAIEDSSGEVVNFT